MNYPIFYSFRRCPYAMRARMSLITAGIKVDLREIVFKDKPAHMLEISPKGTVPILQLTDGTVIDESLGIMFWALQQNDPQQWLDADEQQQRQLIAEFTEQGGAFKKALDRYKYPERYPDANPVQSREQLYQQLHILEKMLTQHTFLFGDNLQLADVAIFPFMRQLASVDLVAFSEQFPHLMQWLDERINSALFLSVMEKYPQWNPDQPETEIVFG